MKLNVMTLGHPFISDVTSQVVVRGKYIFKIRPVRQGPYIENSHLDESHILKIPI